MIKIIVIITEITKHIFYFNKRFEGIVATVVSHLADHADSREPAPTPCSRHHGATALQITTTVVSSRSGSRRSLRSAVRRGPSDRAGTCNLWNCTPAT